MVGLLWESGAQGAALRLEGLWNDLGRSQPFALLCGYHVSQLRNGDRKLIGRSALPTNTPRSTTRRLRPMGDANERARMTARLERRIQRLERELERRTAARSSARRARDGADGLPRKRGRRPAQDRRQRHRRLGEQRRARHPRLRARRVHRPAHRRLRRSVGPGGLAAHSGSRPARRCATSTCRCAARTARPRTC